MPLSRMFFIARSQATKVKAWCARKSGSWLAHGWRPNVPVFGTPNGWQRQPMPMHAEDEWRRAAADQQIIAATHP